jgi:colicin import membrane protein
MKRTLILTWLLAALTVCGAAHAQNASLETKLRDQLRELRGQVQDLQGQQAQWQSQKTALEQERDAARKDAESAKAELASTKGQTSGDDRALAAEHAKQQQLQASADKFKAAYDQASESAHSTEAARIRAAGELATAQEKLDVCSAKNIQLYTVGKDILSAYEHVDMGDLIASRQPFAAKARVRLDNAAQAFGDKLYEQRFDPRSTPKASTDTASSTKGN